MTRRRPAIWRGVFFFDHGGEGGIRTHGNVAATSAFEADALDQLCDLSVLRSSVLVSVNGIYDRRGLGLTGIEPAA